MVGKAMELGYAGVGIADRNSVAGVVRAYVAVREAQEKAEQNIGQRFDFQLAVGARLVFADGTPDIIAYPETRFGWGRLTRMLHIGNLRTQKGGCILYTSALLGYCAGLMLLAMTPDRRSAVLRKRGSQGVDIGG